MINDTFFPFFGCKIYKNGLFKSFNNFKYRLVFRMAGISFRKRGPFKVLPHKGSKRRSQIIERNWRRGAMREFWDIEDEDELNRHILILEQCLKNNHGKTFSQMLDDNLD